VQIVNLGQERRKY